MNSFHIQYKVEIVVDRRTTFTVENESTGGLNSFHTQYEVDAVVERTRLAADDEEANVLNSFHI